MDEISLRILLVIIVIVIIFLIFREIVLWYWKINEGISLLREIRDILQNSTSTNIQSTTDIFEDKKKSAWFSAINVIKQNISKPEKTIICDKYCEENVIELAPNKYLVTIPCDMKSIIGMPFKYSVVIIINEDNSFIYENLRII